VRAASEASNVRQLDDKRDRIGVSYDEESRMLQVAFREPSLEGGIQRFSELSHWLSRPKIGVAFARAFFSHGTDKQPQTRYETFQAIGRFLAFIVGFERRSGQSMSTLTDISQECVSAFVEHVRTSKTKTGAPYKPTSIRNILSPLRVIIRELKGKEHFGHRLPRGVAVESGGYTNVAATIDHTEPLDDITTARVVIASLQEIQRLALAKPILNFPVDKQGRILSNLDWETILERLEQSARSEAEPLTVRETIPYILLLDLSSSFNASTLLVTSQNAVIKNHGLYGRRRWQIRAAKPRAKGRTQTRTFSVDLYSWANPVFLLSALEVYTATLRSLVAPELADRLILAKNAVGVTALYEKRYGLTSSVDDALLKFCADHKIAAFPLNRLRPTSSDIVHQISNGDILRQVAALQHVTSSLDLTGETYQSAAAKRRDRERLARALTFREAFVRSRGKVDATVAFGNPRNGLRAATPGFACIDMFDSPLPHQRKGTPCTGYCLCPACPFGCANVFEPHSVARLKQVEGKLLKAKNTLPFERWTRDYQPQLEALQEEWLPRVTKSLLARASKIILPDIPDIE